MPKKVIIKTNMSEIPNSCKECRLHTFTLGVIACPVVRDWIEPQEFRAGKIKLENCPLEKVK